MFRDADLVLVGHGSTVNAESSGPVFTHAAELRRRGLFANVREAFWKQDPLVTDVIASTKAGRVFVVPFFISEGYFSEIVIPAALGFGGAVNGNSYERTKVIEGRHFVYCKPVGTHTAMTELLLSRARRIVQDFPFPRCPNPRETTLIIAGHGTGQTDQSRKAIEAQVEMIRAKRLFAEVHPAFMEEQPEIRTCHELAKTKNMVVVPFFISDGLHVAEDIPVLLGEPERLVQERLSRGQPTWRNPTERRGKLIWYSPSIGTEPLMANVVLERAKEAAAWFGAGAVD